MFFRTAPLRTSFKLFTDGASRGNPGPAGAGATLLCPNDTPTAHLYAYLGHCTNNEAEYHACLKGLCMAQALHVSRLTVMSDSQLVVRQMDGTYLVQSPRLKALHSRLKRAVANFEHVSFRFVNREQNQVADRLANQAIDTRAPFHMFVQQQPSKLFVRICDS